MQESPPTASHVAYADETHYTHGRYRGLALITLSQEHVVDAKAELHHLLAESEVAEFKWKRLDSAKRRFAAIKMVQWTIRKCLEEVLRVDVLTWDIEDKRHKVWKRDDIANLQRMYYHLFKNVLCERWPDGSTWRLYPDENTAMTWDNIEDFLDRASTRTDMHRDMFTQGKFNVRLRQEFRVEHIAPCQSQLETLTQLADLFAGLAVYSRNSYDSYELWQCTCGPQPRLFQTEHESTLRLSSSDRERCQVLASLDGLCKKHRLGVSLKTHRGLRTLRPNSPINFWWYEPQHEADTAPVKDR